jgi:hypothetical protein
MGCAVGWLPTLLIDNTNRQRQSTAAVESFRNEVVDRAADGRQQLMAMMTNAAARQLESRG